MTDTPDRAELDKLIADSIARFDALSAEEQAEIRRQQKEGYVRAEMSWPEPKYRITINGTKIYESYEDYVND